MKSQQELLPVNSDLNHQCIAFSRQKMGAAAIDRGTIDKGAEQGGELSLPSCFSSKSNPPVSPSTLAVHLLRSALSLNPYLKWITQIFLPTLPSPSSSRHSLGNHSSQGIREALHSPSAPPNSISNLTPSSVLDHLSWPLLTLYPIPRGPSMYCWNNLLPPF